MRLIPELRMALEQIEEEHGTETAVLVAQHAINELKLKSAIKRNCALQNEAKQAIIEARNLNEEGGNHA